MAPSVRTVRNRSRVRVARPGSLDRWQVDIDAEHVRRKLRFHAIPDALQAGGDSDTRMCRQEFFAPLDGEFIKLRFDARIPDDLANELRRLVRVNIRFGRRGHKGVALLRWKPFGIGRRTLKRDCQAVLGQHRLFFSACCA